MKKKLFIVLAVCALMLVLAVPTFAQSTTTLAITPGDITPNLFLGANIMLQALLAIMMLIAGFAFGLIILQKIVNAVTKGIR